MELKKLAYSREPKLHVHRYVVAMGKRKGKKWTAAFHYCASLKEVKKLSKKASAGTIVEVFSATHNFVQAYEVAK